MAKHGRYRSAVCSTRLDARPGFACGRVALAFSSQLRATPSPHGAAGISHRPRAVQTRCACQMAREHTGGRLELHNGSRCVMASAFDHHTPTQKTRKSR